jgi:aromatic ring-cleaving dioxygenase
LVLHIGKWKYSQLGGGDKIVFVVDVHMLRAGLIVPWLNYSKSKSHRQQKPIMCDVCIDHQLGILIL